MTLTERIINKFRKIVFNKICSPKLQKKYSNSLNDKNISIICDNCFGGMLYHDMGLKFMSPTINLYFNMEDYIEFLENLEFYLNCELTDGCCDGEGAVGILNNKVKLYGIHYPSFDELKLKWDERKKRLNLDNLYIIGIYRDGCNDELVKRFCKLPYKNKVFLSHKYIECEGNENIVIADCGKNAQELPPADKMASCKLRAYNSYFDFYDWLSK